MRWLLCCLVTLVIAGLLGGCAAPATPAGKPAPAASAPAPPQATSAPAPAQPTSVPTPGPLTTVTVGQVAAVMYPFYIGIERGYFQEQGVAIEYETFRSGSEMVPLIASGQLDVSQQAVVPSTFNAVLRGVPMKAILDASHADPDQRSHVTLVRKELWDSGQVGTLADLVGRRVATSSLPGGLGIALDRGLRKEGYRIEQVDLAILPFPDMPAALAGGSIDAAVAVEPSITTALSQNSAVPLRWLSEDYPYHQIAVQVIGPNLVQQPELTRRLAIAYLRGARDWNDTIKHQVGVEELARLLTAYNRLSLEANTDLLRRHGFTGIDAGGRINKESLAYDMAWYVERGHLERPIDLDQFVDMQYADYALQQLGPYTPPRRP